MFEKMRAIIAQQLNLPEEEIQEDSNFKEDLDVDSLDGDESGGRISRGNSGRGFGSPGNG